MKQKSHCHGPFCVLLDSELDLDVVVEVDLAAADLAAFLAAIRNFDKFFSIADGDVSDSAVDAEVVDLVDAEVDLVEVAVEEDDFADAFLSTALLQPTFDNEQPPEVVDDLLPLDFLTWLIGGCFFSAAALAVPRFALFIAAAAALVRALLSW